MRTTARFLADHWWLFAPMLFPILVGWINWVLWFDTPEQWEAFAAKYPKRAKWIRVLRTIAPHLRKLLVLVRDGAERASLEPTPQRSFQAIFTIFFPRLPGGPPTPPAAPGASTPDDSTTKDPR